MKRYYTDKGFISKGSMLTIKDLDGKYFMLLPVVSMPATKGAPSTQAKTVLSDEAVTEVEGLQTNDQKTYTFNYHRDNLRQLNKFINKSLEFIEVNPDYTGEKFTGTLRYGRSDLSVDGIVQGEIYITVNSAEEKPLDDVRSLIKETAIITTPLPDVEIIGTNTYSIKLDTSEGASITVTSESTATATASMGTGDNANVLTITGVATGSTIIDLTVSKSGEATSYRSIIVDVKPSA